MEAVSGNNQGKIGRWELHRWCLLASATTGFQLGLVCLVFPPLVRFPGESTIVSACMCRCDNLPSKTSSPTSPHHGFSFSCISVRCFRLVRWYITLRSSLLLAGGKSGRATVMTVCWHLAARPIVIDWLSADNPHHNRSSGREAR